MKAPMIILGGYFIDNNGERVQIPVTEKPNTNKINELFSIFDLKKRTGVILLRIMPEPEIGDIELTIEIEKGYYLPMIQTILENGDIEVKNLKAEVYSGNTVEIFGHNYPIEHTSQNISIVKQVVSEFIKQRQTYTSMT